MKKSKYIVKTTKHKLLSNISLQEIYDENHLLVIPEEDIEIDDVIEPIVVSISALVVSDLVPNTPIVVINELDYYGLSGNKMNNIDEVDTFMTATHNTKPTPKSPSIKTTILYSKEYDKHLRVTFIVNADKSIDYLSVSEINNPVIADLPLNGVSSKEPLQSLFEKLFKNQKTPAELNVDHNREAAAEAGKDYEPYNGHSKILKR